MVGIVEDNVRSDSLVQGTIVGGHLVNRHGPGQPLDRIPIPPVVSAVADQERCGPQDN